MNKPLTAVLAALAALAVGMTLFLIANPAHTLGTNSLNSYDTTSAAFTHATTSINTTSTQIFATVPKFAQIINTTANQITCSLDNANATAASSSVTSGRGVIIPPAYQTTSTGLGIASFGECYAGAPNCYRHKGSVNCLAATTTVVTTSKQP
jgi:hypothetical protein